MYAAVSEFSSNPGGYCYFLSNTNLSRLNSPQSYAPKDYKAVPRDGGKEGNKMTSFIMAAWALLELTRACKWNIRVSPHNMGHLASSGYEWELFNKRLLPSREFSNIRRFNPVPSTCCRYLSDVKDICASEGGAYGLGNRVIMKSITRPNRINRTKIH